jgi:hypothetical protein
MPCVAGCYDSLRHQSSERSACSRPGETLVDLATSRYAAKDLILQSGRVPVGITVGNPRWPLGYQLACNLRLLAPTRPMLGLPTDVFEQIYRARLDDLGWKRSGLCSSVAVMMRATTASLFSATKTSTSPASRVTGACSPPGGTKTRARSFPSCSLMSARGSCSSRSRARRNRHPAPSPAWRHGDRL